MRRVYVWDARWNLGGGEEGGGPAWRGGSGSPQHLGGVPSLEISQVTGGGGWEVRGRPAEHGSGGQRGHRCQMPGPVRTDRGLGCVEATGPEKSEFGEPGGGTGLRERGWETPGEPGSAQLRCHSDRRPRQGSRMNAAARSVDCWGTGPLRVPPHGCSLIYTEERGLRKGRQGPQTACRRGCAEVPQLPVPCPEAPPAVPAALQTRRGFLPDPWPGHVKTLSATGDQKKNRGTYS